MEEAIVAFDKAIEINPNDATHYSNKGTASISANWQKANVLHALGEVEVAQELVDYAVQMDPDNANFHSAQCKY